MNGWVLQRILWVEGSGCFGVGCGFDFLSGGVSVWGDGDQRFVEAGRAGGVQLSGVAGRVGCGVAESAAAGAVIVSGGTERV